MLLLATTVLAGDAPSVGWVCPSVAAPAFLFGVHVSRQRTERITVFDRGMTHRTGRQIDAYGWSDIGRIWQRWKWRRQRLGRSKLAPRGLPNLHSWAGSGDPARARLGLLSLVYTLERQDGRRLRVSRKVPNLEQVVAFIFKGSYRAQRKKLLRGYRSNRRIGFGPINLASDRLTGGRQVFNAREADV